MCVAVRIRSGIPSVRPVMLMMMMMLAVCGVNISTRISKVGRLVSK